MTASIFTKTMIDVNIYLCTYNKSINTLQLLKPQGKLSKGYRVFIIIGGSELLSLDGPEWKAADFPP